MGVSNTYDFIVSTQPMADKMREVSHHVKSTTTAVEVMETAVIAQEKSSADEICGKLDVGFFNVVISQIAQRVANENAKTQALALELMQQQKAMQNLQNRMTGDYNMINARYAKLFGSLNTELKNRITELDKPLMQYCSQNIKQLQNRIYGLVSGVPVLQSESLTATQAIAAARLKHNAQQLIEHLSGYAKHDKQQKDATEGLWCSGEQEAVYYVPVVIDEEDTDSRKGAVALKENPTLRKHLDEVSYQQTVQTISSATSSLNWQQSDETVVNVANNYMAMVDKSELPKRIKDLMASMFNDQFKTL